MTPVGASPSRTPQPKCPIRAGEPCTICQMGVTGPQDCGLVYLVMDDPEMRELWQASRVEARRRDSGTPPAARR